MSYVDGFIAPVRAGVTRDAFPHHVRSADRIRAAGGTVILGPIPVPGGSKAVVALDPQGAAFGMVGPA